MFSFFEINVFGHRFGIKYELALITIGDFELPTQEVTSPSTSNQEVLRVTEIMPDEPIFNHSSVPSFGNLPCDFVMLCKFHMNLQWIKI